MRGPAVSLAVTCALVMSGSLGADASQTDTKSIEARARVSSRTSLTVSSQVLQFSLDDPRRCRW